MKKLSTQDYWEGLYTENGIVESEKRGARSFLRKIVPASVFDIYRRIRNEFNSHDYSLFIERDIIIPSFLPPTKNCTLKYLEIGSAPGGKLVEVSKRYSYEVFGIEYSKSGAEFNKRYSRRMA